MGNFTSAHAGQSGRIGQGPPDEPPGSLPAQPSNAAPAPQDRAGQESSLPSDSLQKRAGHEEPELAQEPDLPSDGRDEMGEAMMRDLPQRPESSEPGPDKKNAP